MASAPIVKTQRRVTRDKLSHALGGVAEVIKQFEALGSDVSVTLPDSIGAAQDAANAAETTADSAVADIGTLRALPFVLIAPTGFLSSERTLAVGLGLKLTDGGANAAVTLDRSDLVSVLPADVTDSTAAFVDATGLVLALEANATYLVDGLITFESAAITTGLGLTFTVPAAATLVGQFHHNSSATALMGSYSNTGGTVKGNTTDVLTAADPVPIFGRWLIKTAATPGNAQLQFRSEVAASQVKLRGGLSVLLARRLA